jgi:hypothetical protein
MVFGKRPSAAYTQCFLMSKTLHLEQYLQTLGGRVTCKRCQAQSKRTGNQCRAPAIAGKNVCRFHGGKSTGPRTPEGRLRCAQARMTHGNETTSVRMERSLASARLAMLESVGFEFGIMTGLKTRGPKPLRMAQVLPELHALAQPPSFAKKVACVSKTQCRVLVGPPAQFRGGKFAEPVAAAGKAHGGSLKP